MSTIIGRQRDNFIYPVTTLAAFLASDYGTPIAWWDFSDGSTLLDGSGVLAGNGTAIGTVLGKAGTNVNLIQGTAGNRLTRVDNQINGLPIIRGAYATSPKMSAQNMATLLSGLSGLTAVWVTKIPDTGGGTSPQAQMFFIQPDFTTMMALFHYDGGAATHKWSFQLTRASGETPVTREPAYGTAIAGAFAINILQIDYANGQSRYSQNGVEVLALATHTTAGVTTTGSRAQLQFGSSGNGGAYFFSGDNAMAIIYNGKLTDVMCTSLYNALKLKYGL